VFAPGDVVISLNYDCLLEGLLDCFNKWSPNGGYGIQPIYLGEKGWPPSSIKVLKVHGSISFKSSPRGDSPERLSVNFDINGHFFPRSGKHSNLRYGSDEATTYVIAPSYVKVPTVEMFRLILLAIHESAKAKNLIIVGCSLRPEDGYLRLICTNFLESDSKGGHRLIIVDPAAVRVGDGLKEFWGVDIANELILVECSIESAVVKLLDEMVV
jgi:hypothetical protein